MEALQHSREHQANPREPPGLLESLALYARLRYNMDPLKQGNPCTLLKVALSYIEDLKYHPIAFKLLGGKQPMECTGSKTGSEHDL